VKFYRTPAFLKIIYPDLIWDLKNNGNDIFLTFDDGPIPDVTEFVLDTLEENKARATFFCVGQNVESNPGLFQRIIHNGHAVGNHSYNHLVGWKVKNNDDYYENIDLCDRVFRENGYQSTVKYFRPPHGRIKLSQIRRLKTEYKIIMWDVLSMDYDPMQTSQECLLKTMKYTRPGSIIIFHDSRKTENKIKFVLPQLMDFFKSQNYNLRNLDEYFIKKDVS